MVAIATVFPAVLSRTIVPPQVASATLPRTMIVPMSLVNLPLNVYVAPFAPRRFCQPLVMITPSLH